MPSSNWGALETALKTNNIEDLKKILESFDITARNSDDDSCVTLGCRHSSSPEIMQLLFEKTVEGGSADLLKTNIIKSNRYSWSSLMIACRHSSSVEIMKLLFAKTVELGGPAVLESVLTAYNFYDKTLFMLGCLNTSAPKIMKLIASLLFHFRLFEKQYDGLGERETNALKEYAGIDSSNWTPNPEIVAQIEIEVFEGVGVCSFLVDAIHKNDHAKMKELLSKKNIDNNNDKILLDLRLNMIIILACTAQETTLETMKVLFSELKRSGSSSDDHQYLEKVLLKENTNGETCLLSVCLRYPGRIELFLSAIEEVCDKEFLIEQVSTCLFMLCKSAPKYSSFSFLVRGIFQSELLGRRCLKRVFSAAKPSCLECIFSRRLIRLGMALNSQEEPKILGLIVSLYSITGLFEAQYSRLDEDSQEKLRSICKIESGEWHREDSSRMGDVIGEIKKSIFKQK